MASCQELADDGRTGPAVVADAAQTKRKPGPRSKGQPLNGHESAARRCKEKAAMERRKARRLVRGAH